MMVFRRLLHSLGVMAALLWIASPALAQYRASIQGVVTDPSGAVVSGATLTLTNQATGEKQVRVTNDAGVYNFNALAPAKYSISVEKKGFKKQVIDNFQFIPEQPNAFNIQLELGEISQSVTVNGNEVPAVDTQTASLNGVVSSNQIQHMPTFGRDVLKLTQLAPGLFADGSQAGGGGTFNLPGTQSGPAPSGGSTGIFATENLVQGYSSGTQAENSGISIDGISTTSAVWGGSTVITPSQDSVDDIKIVTNSYDAEDGRFTGAQVQITSKQGTNDFHGSLFLTSHQPGLNAYQRFNGEGNGVTKDANKFEQFGGSVGGPILKNKLFFFFNYETVREPLSNTQGTGWYETSAFAALAPSNSIASKYLMFPGNGVIGTLNPNATCATAGLVEGVNCHLIPGQGLNIGTPLDPNTFPLGTQDPGWVNSGSPGTGGNGSGGPENLGTVADIANYNTINPTTFHAEQYNGRLDFNATQKDRIGFAIYWVPLTKDNYNGNRAYDIFHHSQINEALSAIWDHTFSPDFLNEFRVNGAGWRWNEVSDNPQSPVGFPVANIDQIGSITLNHFGPNVGSTLNQWTYTFKDVATKIIGRHTVKFGGELTRLFYLQECAGCGVPSYNFFNPWSFLNDAPQSEGGGFNPITGFPTTIRQDQRQALWGLFIQDDFKVRSNLTLNLGLRWSYFGPLSSKQGNMLTSFPGAGSDYLTGLVIKPAHSWDAEKDNFGPQIGFAWSPKSLPLLGIDMQNRLVIRGGYGLSYNPVEIAISANISNNPGLVTFPSLSYSNPTTCGNTLTLADNCGILYALSSSPTAIGGYPSNQFATTSFGPNGLPTSGSVGVQVFPGTLPTTRTHHYSLDVQYDLGHQVVLMVGYQGSLSRDTYFHQNPLVIPAALGYALNPSIGGGDYWSLRGSGNYNALLVDVKHQFSHGLMLDAQYTYSKCMDTSSAPYSEQPYAFDTSGNYGRCDYNVGQAFKLYGMWQPEFYRGANLLAKELANGWSLSGIFTIHSGFPWTPMINIPNGGNLYCGQCGYGTIFPLATTNTFGHSTSIDSFKTIGNSNFPNGTNPLTPGGTAYFSAQECSSTVTTNCYTAFTGTGTGTAFISTPAIARNSLNMPGYKDVDLTIAKAFSIPKMPVLGENANIELRADAYNLFNNMNFNPNNISNNIASSNFGTITAALAARVVTLGIRFSF